MRALLAQIAPVPARVERNVATAAEAIAAHPAVDLAVFPELFLTGYRVSLARDLAMAPSAPELEPLRAACAAAGTAALVGFPERVPGGVANSALAIDERGRTVAVVRKAHLFGAERAAFRPADSIGPIRLAGVELGTMICFDLEFPELARALARGGAEALVTLSANMEPFAADHALFARARALENGLAHLYVNRVGEEAGTVFVGGTCAVDPSGRVVAGTGDGPELLEVEIALEGGVDERLDYRGQLRPELYGARERAGEGSGGASPPVVAHAAVGGAAQIGT